MADIARMAGVSVSAVSLALRGSPAIGEQTRKRIVEIARSLNYRVNVRAQDLRLKSNRTVAVMVPFSTVDRHHLSDPFYLRLVGSIADALVNRGFQMLLARSDEGGKDLAALFETGQAAGIILTGAFRDHEQCNRMALAGVPLVTWGVALPQQLYCSVGSDNRNGARAATAHLLELGARHVAFVGDRVLPEGAERYAGYEEAHHQMGLHVSPGLHRSPRGYGNSVEQEIDALLAQAPNVDAIFASGDMLAMSAIAALRKRGKEVPKDVRVAGFDDIELAAFFQPALTTVRQPMDAIGTAIVEALVTQLSGRKAPPVQLPASLVVRQSCGNG